MLERKRKAIPQSKFSHGSVGPLFVTRRHPLRMTVMAIDEAAVDCSKTGLLADLEHRGVCDLV